MFGGNLRYFRLKENLTKKELAAKAGVSAALITYYESGERQPTIQSVKSLATALSSFWKIDHPLSFLMGHSVKIPR